MRKRNFEELLQEGGKFRKTPNVKDEGDPEPILKGLIVLGKVQRIEVESQQ